MVKKRKKDDSELVGKIERKWTSISDIKFIPVIIQANTGWCGAYNLVTGTIELGSTEHEVVRIIFHEMMHKYLFERESLESCYMWDNIAIDVEKHLFGEQKYAPYIWTLPIKKVETIINKHKTLKEKGLEKEIESVKREYYKRDKEMAKTLEEIKKEVILLITECPGITQNEIAKKLHLSYRFATKLFDEMIKNGEISLTDSTHIKEILDRRHETMIILS